MDSADFNVDDFTEKGASEADKQLLVKFELIPVEDAEETLKQGRPIFKEIEIIDIRVPGQRNSVKRARARGADKARFPEHYKLFLERVSSEHLDGTPLAQYPAISRTLVEELAFFNVKTVEHLANLSDEYINKFPNGNAMKAAAKEWLERAGTDGSINKLKAELDSKDARLAKLEAQIEKLLAEDEEDEEPAPKKKRRPKAATE